MVPFKVNVLYMRIYAMLDATVTRERRAAIPMLPKQVCYNLFAMALDIALNDVVRLRKPHPCGGYEWTVVRLGADIGMVCNTCQHRVLLPRRDFEKRVKKFVSRQPRPPARADDAVPDETRIGPME
jgi:hypothetical protein